ncbi:hypothetical protein JB92DRAFT_2834222 [Gautieria morchelliformis]|nr:hypothetical protein JB92DRAFT_2834222 [Gautieria morchelliformis]
MPGYCFTHKSTSIAFTDVVAAFAAAGALLDPQITGLTHASFVKISTNSTSISGALPSDPDVCEVYDSRTGSTFMRDALNGDRCHAGTGQPHPASFLGPAFDSGVIHDSLPPLECYPRSVDTTTTSSWSQSFRPTPAAALSQHTALFQPPSSVQPKGKPRPWPQPTGPLDTDSGNEKENEIPEPSALLRKSSAGRPGMRQGVEEGDVSVRSRGKKAGAAGGVSARKKGRRVGAANWTDEDITALLDFAEEILPAGKKEWGRMYELFAEWAKENRRPLRSLDTMEKHFKGWLHVSKPTGNAECPPEIERAHAIEDMITTRVASGVVCDDDMGDEVINISSDDCPKVVPTMKTYVEPESDGKGCMSSGTLRGTLQNIARAFDPSVQAARDESRRARQFEAIHLQTLTSQLRDAEAETCRLCNELTDTQRQCDNAERDLCMYEMMRNARHQDHHAHSLRMHSSRSHSQRYDPYDRCSPRRYGQSHSQRDDPYDRRSPCDASPFEASSPLSSHPQTHRNSSSHPRAHHNSSRQYGGTPRRYSSSHSPEKQPLQGLDEANDKVEVGSIEWPPTPGPSHATN